MSADFVRHLIEHQVFLRIKARPLYLGSMTTAQRNALPAINGLAIYNTTDDEFQFHEAGAWRTFSVGLVPHALDPAVGWHTGTMPHATLSGVTFAQHHTHGGYYIWGVFYPNTTAITMGTNALHLTPFVPYCTMTVDRLIIDWSTPTAGNVRAAIYPDNGAFAPDGESPLRTVASVAKAIANNMQEFVMVEGSIQLTAHTIYWLASISDEATTNVAYFRWSRGGTLQSRSVALGAYAIPDPCPVTAPAWNVASMGARVTSIP